jgi:uncharacterized protein
MDTRLRGYDDFLRVRKFWHYKKREDTILDKLPDKQPIGFQEGQRVELVIGDRTDLGYKAMIDDSQWGMLYKNEVFQPLRKGQHIKGYIKKVRDDGKIDLCLQKPGPEKVDEVAEKIIETLRAAGGFVSVTDKSQPEIIYGLFGVSKKTYKKAIGALYRKRRIIIESDGIKLL